MSAYAIAVLRPTAPVHPDVLTYIERVQDTFTPYGGRFLSHGKPSAYVEGERLGDLVIAEFPDLAHAHAWYASPAYQAILPLRTAHIPGEMIFVEGVPADYDAAHTATTMRAALRAGAGEQQ
ncbi:DUF1330 domain-containing protein [Streptomyces sp. NPDC049813]|uniref:DUF1330 domain-containing protein n=1 Tax=Streptomyces sp. NPDC049813 TaxID=3365597 RepID=UPI00378DE429